MNLPNHYVGQMLTMSVNPRNVARASHDGQKGQETCQDETL